MQSIPFTKNPSSRRDITIPRAASRMRCTNDGSTLRKPTKMHGKPQLWRLPTPPEPPTERPPLAQPPKVGSQLRLVLQPARMLPHQQLPPRTLLTKPTRPGKSPADTPNDHRKAATMRQKSPKTHSLLQRPDIGFGGLLGLLTAAIAVVRGLNAPELGWCLSATLVYARFVSAVSAALNGVWNSRLSQLTMIYGVLTLLIFLASSAILQINPLSAAVLVALTSFPIDLLIQSLRKKGATPR